MQTYAFLLAFFLTLLTMLAMLGCQRIAELDEQIWDKVLGPPTTSPAGIDPGAQPPDPGAPPPIIEVAASILALFGYGGLSTWIYKSAQNGKRRSTMDNERMDRLLERIRTLETRDAQDA